MKKIYLVLIFLPSILFGQITVTVSDMSDGGDTAWISTALDPAIDFASTGANYTWDFSGLTPNSQELKEYHNISDASFLAQSVFGFFAPSAYQATNFVSSTAIPLDQISTFLPITISDIVAFSKNATSEVNSIGFSMTIEGIEVPFKSDTIETRYALPLNYGDSYSSHGYSNIDMNPIYNGIWRQHRFRSSNVDGWGTITTPYGTFNALRIDHAIQESDSIYMDLLGSGMWIPLPIPDSHEYEWWTNGEKEPILRITTNVVFGNEAVTKIEYRDFQMASSLDEIEMANITVYPNPVTDRLFINGLTSEVNYTIYNLQGEKVDAGQLNSAHNDIKTGSIEIGTYSLVLSSGAQQSSHTFIKK